MLRLASTVGACNAVFPAVYASPAAWPFLHLSSHLPAPPAGATPLYVSLNVNGSISANSGFQGFDLSKDAGALCRLHCCLATRHSVGSCTAACALFTASLPHLVAVLAAAAEVSAAHVMHIHPAQQKGPAVPRPCISPSPTCSSSFPLP